MCLRRYYLFTFLSAVCATTYSQVLYIPGSSANHGFQLPIMIPDQSFTIHKLQIYEKDAPEDKAYRPLAELSALQATNVQFDDVPENHVIDELEPHPTIANGSNVIPVIDANAEEAYGDPLAYELYDDDYDQSIYEWTYELDTGERGELRPMDMDEHVEKMHIKSGINVNKGCPFCKCGVSGFNRLVGGGLSKKYQYPWVGAYYVDNFFSCGGSLINNLFVATAAQCVHGVKVRRMKVVLNDYNVENKRESRQIVRKVMAVYTPIQYNPSTKNRDFALIRLKKRVNVGWGLLRPLCLPRVRTEYDGRTAIVAGWSTLPQNGKSPRILHKHRVPVISNQNCRRSHTDHHISDFMLCAAHIRKDKDICKGDSGGPLMVKEKNRHTLAGIVSFGNGCGHGDTPGVYTRVTKFMYMIKRVTKGACYCKL